MEVIGTSGYFLAACAYAVFILLLLAARNKTLAGGLMLLAALLVFSSSLSAALQPKQGFSLLIVMAIETFKVAVWSLLIICTQANITSVKALISHPKVKQYLKIFSGLSVLCWGAALFMPDSVKYLFSLFLLLNLWLLVLLEQLYRNADVKVKWAIWSLIIALGMATVFDFVLFAQAAMVNQLDFSYWYARGFIAAIGMPLILVSTRRIKDWSVDVFVSREVVFYSSMLLISGLYLLLLAIAGYVINYFGGAWGDVISIAFIILGGSVLAALLIAERLRREVKVFITKHFFANKYDYRVEWLKSIEQLEIGENDDCYHTATHIMCSSLNIHQGALIKKVTKNHYQAIYQQNFELEQSDLHFLIAVDQFCQQNGWIIDVRELAMVEDSYPGLVLDARACEQKNIDMIIPIFMNKVVYGFFLLALPEEQGELNWEDRDLLFSLSKQLSNYLSLNEANESLAESKQFDAFNRMSAFLVHDLKNIQAQLALVNSNAKRHRDNPAFIDDVFETIESATGRLDKVLTQLRNKQVVESTKKTIDVQALIETVIEQRNVQLPHISAQLAIDNMISIDEETFSSVLNHLLQNAQEATNESGWVKISAERICNNLHISIVDNGCGMSVYFIRNRLFKPFDTTKGNAGMGIGVYEAKQFVESIGGTMQVASFENEGSIFTLVIPCSSND
ncbi:XrtA/PEP-CTERM system histidine kinase PrsK [Colwellia psychrerythraea]|uniref:histidine kinase n=1 Tax=Colwellia psychrerythraea (strain 34H / ATCC BAA-681) TaxID=167879 RepID=Q47U53_COLP3|nr:XrtA/PEP-CTERM system histidine kinase PrsK [Colwellia psychrerythraea]AAZ27644.1 sensor histidine kinase [Colwellia psychrerythraea 34H]